MYFYKLAGKVALGSRLRRLADVITADAAKVYQSYNIDVDPRWFPILYMLSKQQNASISQLASDIAHTHSSVSQTVKQMVKKGIAQVNKDKVDTRVTMVSLTEHGLHLVEKLEEQSLDVYRAVEKLEQEAEVSLWQALEQTEAALSDINFLQRVTEQRKDREKDEVEIIPFSSKHTEDFARLNLDWIEQNFEVEPTDKKALNAPQKNILDNGGYIYIALFKKKVVGTCALLNMNDGVFELAKMAVSGEAKGKGIGYLLGQAVIEKAKEIGANSVYLESNTKLVPAINLYHKLGFEQIQGKSSPYQRCNIQMELKLAKNG
jgi:DNA-binding MarR family transcriptional regulator/N-acetylglutamate synthase-like GNAT family acetyltransferase